MKMLKNTQGFGALGAIVILIVVSLVGAGGWYVFIKNQGKDKDSSSEQTSVSRKNNSESKKVEPSEYDGWKTYIAEDGSLSFKYPGTWFVRTDASLNRVLVSTAPTSVTKEDRPDDFQMVWFAIDSEESSTQNETSIKDGNPQGREVSGDITAGQIKSGDLVITTYEYNTVGGSTLQAFWANSQGVRFYATNSTEVGIMNQQNMVTNLKKMLASVVVK